MISIVIPTYNEKENLPPLFQQISNSLKDTNFELIIVDDNSPDQTASFAEHLSKTYKFVRVIRRVGKLGLASAVRDGVLNSRGEFILVMDADLSHPPQTIPSLLNQIKTNDIVVGSRLISGGEVKSWPIYRKIISQGADGMARLMLGIKITDPMSGFFIVKKEIFQKSRIRVSGYKILLNLLYDNPQVKVKEIPYTFRDRFRGQTKLGVREMINYVFDVLKLRFG